MTGNRLHAYSIEGSLLFPDWFYTYVTYGFRLHFLLSLSRGNKLVIDTMLPFQASSSTANRMRTRAIAGCTTMDLSGQGLRKFGKYRRVESEY